MGMVFVGHDWAEEHHDVHVEDEQGRRVFDAVVPHVAGARRGDEVVIGSTAFEFLPGEEIADGTS